MYLYTIVLSTHYILQVGNHTDTRLKFKKKTYRDTYRVLHTSRAYFIVQITYNTYYGYQHHTFLLLKHQIEKPHFLYTLADFVYLNLAIIATNSSLVIVASTISFHKGLWQNLETVSNLAFFCNFNLFHS